MTQALRYQFELFGALKGRTKSINGHLFTNGRCDIICDSNSAPYLLKYMSFYGAFARGTSEYEIAKGNENVTDSFQESKQRNPTEQVQGGGSENKQEPPEVSPNPSEGTATVERGEAGERPDRNGYEDSGVPTFEEHKNRVQPKEPSSVADDGVRAAVLKLDPENDNHWTTQGLPRVDAVEEAYGKAGITRGDIKSAFPNGWDRDAAIQRAMGSNA